MPSDPPLDSRRRRVGVADWLGPVLIVLLTAVISGALGVLFSWWGVPIALGIGLLGGGIQSYMSARRRRG